MFEDEEDEDGDEARPRPSPDLPCGIFCFLLHPASARGRAPIASTELRAGSPQMHPRPRSLQGVRCAPASPSDLLPCDAILSANTLVIALATCHRKRQFFVTRNRLLEADSSFAVWSPQCQTSCSVVGGAILIPAVCRAWNARERSFSRRPEAKRSQAPSVCSASSWTPQTAVGC